MSPVITRSTPLSRTAGALALLLVLALAAAPWWGSSATLHLIGEFSVYLALASLWNLLAGHTGLVSVGQQAYVGLGGYALFTAALFAEVHPLLAIPLAGLVAPLVAALVFRLQVRLFRHWHLGGGRGVSPLCSPTGGAGRRLGDFAASPSDKATGRQGGARGLDLLGGAGDWRGLSGHGLPAAGGTGHRGDAGGPQGIWGYVAARWNLSLFPVGYRISWGAPTEKAPTEKAPTEKAPTEKE